jgi:hypothetical protein
MESVLPVPAEIGRTYRRLGLRSLRSATAVTVLWFLWRHVGTVPFQAGLRAVTWPGVLAAVTLTALTTVCSAGRWRVAAQALGIGTILPAAVRSYYRSLFLNSVLIGDVHRAVPGAGLLLGGTVRRRRDQGQRSESRRPDPAPQVLEVVRD